MFTRDDYRKQGIANSLLEKLVEEARCRGIKKIWLGASQLGRPVYEKIGFRQTEEWLEMDIR